MGRGAARRIPIALPKIAMNDGYVSLNPNGCGAMTLRGSRKYFCYGVSVGGSGLALMAGCGGLLQRESPLPAPGAFRIPEKGSD